MNTIFGFSNHMAAFLATFIIAAALGPIMIPALRRLKFGQNVRDDGPSTHFKKTGTPTMGGLIFLVALLAVSVYFAVKVPGILPLALVTLGFGFIGFLDDFIKIIKKRKDGLYAHQKMFGLLLISAIFAFYIDRYTDIGTDIIIPFLGMDATIDLAWAFIPFTVFVLLSVTNAVNITDGLDGLAAGVTLIVMIFFTVSAMTRSQWEHIKIFSSMVGGGCLGFLVYNIHPARVFMGDTGSLALGGAVGAIAIMMKMPLFILIVGAVYVVEALSVILQVGSFRLRGKRVFRMAPIHHHFELSGWRETKVVWLFLGFTLVCCMLGFAALRLRFF